MTTSRHPEAIRALGDATGRARPRIDLRARPAAVPPDMKKAVPHATHLTRRPGRRVSPPEPSARGTVRRAERDGTGQPQRWRAG